MAITIWQVDSFTTEPFHGNPAGVCILKEPRPEEWMAAVAREMNLSETAFLLQENEGFHLRWFTPAVEVELCGHATLASAHVLWSEGVVDPGASISFRTLSGRLGARRNSELIELDFPARPPRPIVAPAGLAAALGVEPLWVGHDGEDHLVLVEDEATVRSLAPNMTALGQVDSRGVTVTARAKDGEHSYDFVSRFFGPAVGVPEDPVTGSAHCCLGPFWGERLDKTEMVGYQASARGGSVRVRLEGDRVALGGNAVTTLRGELLA